MQCENKLSQLIINMSTILYNISLIYWCILKWFKNRTNCFKIISWRITMDSSCIYSTQFQMLETKYQHMLLHPSPQNQIYPAQCIECIAKARSIKGVYQLLNSLVGNLLSRFSLQVTWDMLDYCPWWMRLSAHHARQLYSIYRLQSRRYVK